MPAPALAHYPGLYDASRLAVSVLDADSFELFYANDAFQHYYRARLLTNSKHLLRDALIQQAIKQCHENHQTLSITPLGSQLCFEFSPFNAATAIPRLVQCILLPRDMEMPQPQRDDLPHDLLLALARIIDHFPHNIWLYSIKGEVLWTNNTSNRFTIGTNGARHIVDLANTRHITNVHPDDLTEAAVAMSQVINGTPMQQPKRYRLRNHTGQYCWFEFSMSPVHDDAGQVLYWVGTSINIEHIVALEQEHEQQLQLLQQQLRSANDELHSHHQRNLNAEKMALINHLSGGVAHDLNNLLQVMRTCTELAMLKRPEASVETKLKLIADCIERASRLSSQLASFTGRTPQNARQLDTSEVLRECMLLLKRAVGAEADFKADIPDGLHPVLADRAHLENALINLAINARDAVDGRGQIRFAARNIEHAEPDGQICEAVQLCLRDDGSGIDESLREQVFEPFFTTKPEGKGTGLGLAMVKRFVQSSHGSIELSSRPEQGTNVSIVLPRSRQQAETASHNTPVPASLQARVLLVEDDEPVRLAIHALLSQLGCTVIPSFNIDHALGLLDSGLCPEAIVSDIRMPGSHTARDLIARIEQRPDIALLFATGYSADVAVAEGLIDGRWPVLFKPFDLHGLAAALRQILPQAADTE